MAAGLTVTRENMPIFAERFNAIISRMMLEEKGDREFLVDYCPRPEEVLDERFLAHYHQLEPFGNGNPEPVFLLEKSRVSNPGTVKNHLKYSLEVNGQTYRAIGFGLADKMEIISGTESVHLAVKIKSSVFRGVKRTELHTVNVFHPHECTGQG